MTKAVFYSTLYGCNNNHSDMWSDCKWHHDMNQLSVKAVRLAKLYKEELYGWTQFELLHWRWRLSTAEHKMESTTIKRDEDFESLTAILPGENFWMINRKKLYLKLRVCERDDRVTENVLSSNGRCRRLPLKQQRDRDTKKRCAYDSIQRWQWRSLRDNEVQWQTSYSGE